MPKFDVVAVKKLLCRSTASASSAQWHRPVKVAVEPMM
jgi:hypothetical protein